MPNASRRVVRMQRQILKAVRADVRRIIGPQNAELRRYYDSYKREFRGPARHATKEELRDACLEGQVILMGDYHTFAQSQKAAVRLLAALVEHDPWIAVGLEVVPSRHQPALDEFCAGRLTEAEFLARVDYASSWGFRWENFRPLFEFARSHNLQLLALNHDSERLDARDTHAARLIAQFAATHPRRRIFALYGDLHLARGHIPGKIRSELRRLGARRRIVTVFQNSETLYWRLAESGVAHAVDVLSLGRDRYCIMNAAPWVKLQSYLEWAEAGGNPAARFRNDDSDDAGTDLGELARERLRHLCETLGMDTPPGVDFTVRTSDHLEFLGSRAGAGTLAPLTREQLKTVKYHVLGSRSLFIPGPNIIYLASTSYNALSEAVTLAAHTQLSGSPALYHDPRSHFYAAVLTKTIAYFGSKVLNHKRKCDLEVDFRKQAARRLGRHALPQERLQQRVARLIVRHCEAQREFAGGKRSFRAPPAPRGGASVPLFLETAHGLGAILGEKLFTLFAEGRIPAARIERLLRARLDTTREARALYLALVSALERAKLSHESKGDLF